MASPLDLDRAEEALMLADVVDLDPVWRSSNYVFLATMRGPGGATLQAIYKPRRGESPLWDFPGGTLYQREAAAYRLARLLDWPVVPPTVVRDGPEGVGSFQLFVAHDPRRHFFVLREEEELIPQLQRMAAFDVVANNADRKGGHCLLDDGGIIWGIDHGVCFHDQFKLRTVIWDWADESIDPELLMDVASAIRCIESGDISTLPLIELLSPAEAAALVHRGNSLIEAGRLPRPGAYRPYPWPLI